MALTLVSSTSLAASSVRGEFIILGDLFERYPIHDISLNPFLRGALLAVSSLCYQYELIADKTILAVVGKVTRSG